MNGFHAKIGWQHAFDLGENTFYFEQSRYIKMKYEETDFKLRNILEFLCVPIMFLSDHHKMLRETSTYNTNVKYQI